MTESLHNKSRQDILHCYQAGLQAVHGRQRVLQYLHDSQAFSGNTYALVAIGKAASAMVSGATDWEGAQLHRGLVITKAGYAEKTFTQSNNIEIIESAHPIPDEQSLSAGQRLIAFLQGLPETMPVLFLISGGTSALVEVLEDGVTLSDLQALTNKMLAEGMNISQINYVRQQLSKIKGGGLLDYLGQHPVLNLMISDVPDNDPAIIGSGLLIRPKAHTPDKAGLPPAVEEYLSSHTRRKAINMPDVEVESSIIANNQTALQAAAGCAKEMGYEVTISTDVLSEDVGEIADLLIQQLDNKTSGMYIWGGEPTVMLPAKPGRGGRNQHLALLLAEQLQTRKNIQILVAATDGSDGPTEDAGGMVDFQTIQRGEAEGQNARKCLNAANAGAFLEASGDLISTGPTGSNVMDLVIACKS